MLKLKKEIDTIRLDYYFFVHNGAENQTKIFNILLKLLTTRPNLMVSIKLKYNSLRNFYVLFIVLKTVLTTTFFSNL
jgi:hypothetical protein